MRLDKLLAHTGFGSRKEAKQLLKKGLVTVDGQAIKKPETHVDPEKSTIYVASQLIKYEKYTYIMMNKPAGVISATYDDQWDTVIDLLSEDDSWCDLFPVGRLDKDTTGLMVLSNDGGFAHRALSPKKHVEKIYRAVLNAPIGDKEIKAFEDGIVLVDDEYKCMPAGLSALDEEGLVAEVVIREGKFHQVKRMFEACGIKVLSLKRTHFAGIPLDDTLEESQYRRFTFEELAKVGNLLSKD
ncbi:MAG: rRNA pseudouridine synthase [Defluviitaleaceae bacterium]|nr:rRNA pseudouridine synthase [Defluviitaleaceae bacterium]